MWPFFVQHSVCVELIRQGIQYNSQPNLTSVASLKWKCHRLQSFVSVFTLNKGKDRARCNFRFALWVEAIHRFDGLRSLSFSPLFYVWNHSIENSRGWMSKGWAAILESVTIDSFQSYYRYLHAVQQWLLNSQLRTTSYIQTDQWKGNLLLLLYFTVIFTARVRSTRKGTCFTGACLSTFLGGEYPIWLRGNPFPGQVGIPHLFDGSTPSFLMTHSWVRMGGYPIPGQEGAPQGSPPIRTGWGTPTLPPPLGLDG